MDINAVMDFSAPLIRSLNERGAFLCVKGNVMTIGWAQVGVIWGKPILTVLVRPSRYTYGVIEKTAEFTVSVPYSGKMAEALAYAGTVSRRDEDKFAGSLLKPVQAKFIDAPVVGGCEFYAECKVVSKTDLAAEYIDKGIISRFYDTGDVHRMYMGDIIGCYPAAK